MAYLYPHDKEYSEDSSASKRRSFEQSPTYLSSESMGDMEDDDCTVSSMNSMHTPLSPQVSHICLVLLF